MRRRRRVLARLESNAAQQVHNEDDHQDGPKADAGAPAHSPTPVAVIAPAETEDQYQNNDEQQHLSPPFPQPAARSALLLAQNHVGEQLRMYVDPAVTCLAGEINQPQASKLVHEKCNSRVRVPDHLRQRLLAYAGRDRVSMGFRRLLSEACELQECSRQPLFAMVEELVANILLKRDVAGQQLRQKGFGKRMVMFQRLDQGGFF